MHFAVTRGRAAADLLHEVAVLAVVVQRPLLPVVREEEVLRAFNHL